MSHSNDGQRTPTPNRVQMHFYTDESGWTPVDPNVPISQQPIASSWFSNPSQPDNQQSGFRAMYVESSTVTTSDQPQQRGMMISAGLPPMNTTDNQGVNQTPMQALMFHSNRPFANIPPPPGFENFPPPVGWGPGNIPIPPFPEPRFNQGHMNEFGFPPTAPAPMPPPWMVTSFQTNATLSGTMEQARFSPTNPDNRSERNRDGNTNNTANAWCLRTQPTGVDVPGDCHLNAFARQSHSTETKSVPEICKSSSIGEPTLSSGDTSVIEDHWDWDWVDAQQLQLHPRQHNCHHQHHCYHSHQLIESNTQNSHPLSKNASAVEKTWAAKRYQLRQRERTADPLVQFRYRGSRPSDAVRSESPSIVQPEPIMVPSEVRDLYGYKNGPATVGAIAANVPTSAHVSLPYMPCLCECGHRTIAHLPSTNTDFFRANGVYPRRPDTWSHSVQSVPSMPVITVPYGPAGTCTDANSQLLNSRTSNAPRHLTLMDKATSTDEPCTGVKSHKVVWGIILPLARRPLCYETLTEQQWAGEQVENLASVNLNATHKILTVGPTERPLTVYPTSIYPSMSYALSNRRSDSSDSLLTTFVNVASNKFNQELRRLESRSR